MCHQVIDGIEFKQGRRLNRYVELLFKLGSDLYGLYRVDAKLIERYMRMQFASRNITPLADVLDEPVF